MNDATAEFWYRIGQAAARADLKSHTQTMDAETVRALWAEHQACSVPVAGTYSGPMQTAESAEALAKHLEGHWLFDRQGTYKVDGAIIAAALRKLARSMPSPGTPQSEETDR